MVVLVRDSIALFNYPSKNAPEVIHCCPHTVEEESGVRKVKQFFLDHTANMGVGGRNLRAERNPASSQVGQ